ncbi:MAG: exo-alpha-sialidase [Tyzzerella sp.]|nr:exo-alpha-sialidase [Tyzzerella sp.]
MANLKLKKLLALLLVCCCFVSVNFHTLLLNATDTNTDDTVTAITVDGVESGITLWQGFEISPYDYDLTVTYESGATETIPMTVDMIGKYDNITVGTKSVTISYAEVSTELSLTINERHDEISEFGLAVQEHADATNITLSGHEKSINALIEQYNSFSGYEVSLLDATVVQKYEALEDALYRLEHTDLAVYDTVYTEDFNRYLHDDEWTIYSVQSSGSWRTFNGMLVNEQLRYGWSSADKKASYLDYIDFYGEVNSVESDIYIPSDETGWYASLLSCVNDDGYYMARIYYTGTYSEGYGKIQLLKYVNGTYETLDSCNVYDWWNHNVRLTKDGWDNLRLTVIDGTLTVYLNDTQMLQYKDNTFKTGTFGFRSNCGDMRYDSLRVMGKVLDSGKYIPQIEETYFEDSFSDEQYVTGGEPNFWIEETDSNLWKLFDLENDGNLSYGTNSKQYSYTWLHTFEKDPTIQMDFMVSDAEEDGRIEFLTRYAGTMECYAGIGYDFSESKWYIYTDKGEDFDSRTFYAEETVSLSENMWHTIRIEEKGRYVQVYLDDVLIVEDTEAYMTGYGRVGVLSENANLYIDNFSYTMPHGGSVSNGVNEILFDYDTYGVMSHMEIESLGNGTLLGISGSNNRFVSTDNGLTWNKITDAYTSVKGQGLAYPSILQLATDTYIMVYADTFTVWKSTDGMKSWTQIGTVIDDIGTNKTEDGQWIHILHVNSLSKINFTDRDGEKVERIFLPVGVRRFSGTSITGHYTRVFYSDDGGTSWSESTNNTSTINPTYEEDSTEFSSWCETKIIMGSDSVLRMYNTREYDCTVYTESHDFGKTWEGIYSVPYLQNSTSSYGIAQDPETGIYYMACLNNAARNYNSAMPRNRLSLIRSIDGKNWEFVMDIERFSSCANYLSTEIYQILDPSITIADGYMYITMGRSYAASSGHNRQSILLERLEMSKLPESTEWNDANIADATRAKKLEIFTDPTYDYSVGDTFSLDGGVVKATAFNGQETYYDMSELRMITDEPDMTTQGVYKVVLMNDYAQTVSFEVGVGLETYQVKWKIHGQGTVSSLDEIIYEGQRKTFIVTVEDGWKLGCVMVNGEAIELTNNKFVITGSTDITIDVICVEDVASITESSMLIYYEDTFKNEETYINAIDSAGEGVSNWNWSENSLSISTKANWFSLFGGIHARKNYTISADVQVPDHDYLGVVAYGSTNPKRTVTYGYEFAIYNNNFRLYSRGSSGSYVLPDSNSTPAVTSYFPTYKSGDTITLALTAITTSDNTCTLICKATYAGVTETIFAVSDEKYCSGMAGIRGNSVGSIVKNVRVTNAEPLLMESVILNGDDTVVVSQYFEESKVEGLTLSDYIYEADVTLTDVLLGQTDGIRTASLCVGTTATTERTGYEFGIVRATDGALTVRLYDCSKETAVYNASCDEVTQAYKNGENVHLKVVVRGNSIRCYVNATYICEYNADSSINEAFGVRGDYAVSIFDNVYLTIIQDNYMEVDVYRTGDTYLVPDNTGYSGYVFGGWFIDGGLTTPLDASTKIGDAYAKWVDADVLSVKAQISANLLDKDTTNDSTASIRFVTTVDSLDYQKVGFVFSIGGKEMTVTSRVVYKELYAVGAFGGTVTYAPWDEFSPQSAYFKAFTFTDIPKEDYDTDIRVKSYWITLDGTYVYGESVVKTVNMGMSHNDGSDYDGDGF